jgi:gamma-glutamylaminecyclotransferase
LTSAIRFFICGSALRGQPDHGVLEGAVFLGEARTAPRYRMHSVDDVHPAVYAAKRGGASIAGELYELSPAQHAALLAQEPPRLYEGDVILADRSHARAMLFPRTLVEERGYPDISAHGGWATYKRALGKSVDKPAGKSRASRE